MARLTLSLLGSFEVTLDGGPTLRGRPVTAFQTAKVRALLAYLTVEADRPHARESLAGLLWPDYPERSARTNLRNALANLRLAIGDRDATPSYLLVSHEAIQFNLESDHWLDVTAFTELAGLADPSSLEEAMTHYRGPFLEGFSLPDSPPFEQWVLVTRERLQRQAMAALGRLAAYYETRGELESAVTSAWRQLEIEPWHEAAHRSLMRLLALRGERATALAQYEACQRALKEELDVEPSVETTQLYEQIRDGAVRREAEPDSLSLIPSIPHNLPVQLTPFVGRVEELASIAHYLADPACRLLTMVGPGGSGKTRLALEAAAAEVSRYRHGVFFVSLAPLQSPESIVPTVAQAIGFSFRRGEEPRQQLLDYLRQKQMLLLLDDFEHLLARPEGRAGERPEQQDRDAMGLIGDILQAAPAVKVLVTSRAALNVQTEQLFLVSGMQYPALASSPSPGRGESDDPGHYSAVQLFLQAARRVRPGFEPTTDELAQIVEICHCVEGMPLALLLAAAWVRLLTPAEIAAEVRQGLDLLQTEGRDLPERQRSMRAVFGHSWRLLSEREQAVFAALSVFRGGFTRQAGAAVAGAAGVVTGAGSPRARDWLPLLQRLVSQSLLQRTPGGRYELHELLRQYAQERLGESADGGQGARDRHSATYCAALERWGADLKGPRQRAALAEMDVEIDNARVAWEWVVEQRHWGQLAQAAEGLHLFYDRRWHRSQGEATFRHAAERLEAVVAGPAPASAEAIQTLVQVLARQGSFTDDDTACRWMADRCQELLARPELAGRDVRRERGLVLLYLSRALAGMDEDRARSLFEQGLALYRELGDRWAQAELLGALARLDYYAGDCQGAVRLGEESLALFRTLGDRWAMSACLFYLNLSYRRSEQFEEAEHTVQEQMAFAREWGDRAALAQGLDMQGGLLWTTGRFGEAVEVHEKGYMPLLEELGDRHRWAQAKAWLGRFKLDSGDYAPVRALAEESLAIGRELSSQLVLCYALPALAKLAMLEERYAEARQLYRETLEAAEEHGAPVYAIWYRGELAVPWLRLGDASQARHDLCDALRMAASGFTGINSIFLLPPAAELLAHEGQLERAVEIYALAWRYALIANSRWYQDVLGPPMAAVAATLPPEVVEAARARGRARDLQATVKELLAELEAS